MKTFIFLVCASLSVAFYQMSGGANFEPKPRVLSQAEPAVQDTANLPVEKPITTKAIAPLEELIVASVVSETDTAETSSALLGYEVIPATEAPAAIEEIVDAVATASVLDLRYVAGSRVNMREGPSTNFGVIETLAQGTAAEILSISDDGWAQVRLVDNGQTGWMAERLLSES